MSSKNKPPTILDVIKSAQPVSDNLDVDKFSDRRVGDFCISDGRIWFMRKGRDFKDGKPVEIPTALSHNFIALIDEQFNYDDGIQSTTAFAIIGRHKSGRLLSTLTIQSHQYSAMQWPVKHWGALSIIEADAATPRRLANGIMILSGDIATSTIYQHTGWRQIDKDWYYLSASGALGATGLDASIRVDLGAGRLNNYRLPAPNKEPRQVARFLFDLLGIAQNKPAVGVSLFCCVCRAVLGELVPTDFSLFLSGLTGSGKTECAGIAQSCFGDFNSRNLPASFKDTEGALELKTHRTKDALLVVDDLKPGTSRKEKDAKIAKFDYLVTASADQMGRSRLTPDATEKAAYHPRCMVLITGEYIPDQSASTLGRLLVIEMTRDDVDWSNMSRLQDMAAQGRYCEAITHFIQWLAPKIPELKRTFRKTLQTARDDALQSSDKFASSHPRVGDIYGSMKCASDLYLDFALEVGAIGKITAQEHSETIDRALKSAIRSQSQFQKDSNEVEVFFSLLRSCFAGGECHVSNYLRQGPPIFHPFVWGWRSSTDDHYTEHISSKKEDQGKSSKKEDQDESVQKKGNHSPPC